MDVAGPVLLVVDDDPRALLDVERELLARYTQSYRVMCAASAEDAMAKLEALAAAGEDVALVSRHSGSTGRPGATYWARCGLSTRMLSVGC